MSALSAVPLRGTAEVLAGWANRAVKQRGVAVMVDTAAEAATGALFGMPVDPVPARWPDCPGCSGPVSRGGVVHASRKLTLYEPHGVTLQEAATGLRLPSQRVSQHFMWNDRRHAAPQPTAGPHVAVPEPVDQLVDQLNLPPLSAPLWLATYQALSDYTWGHRVQPDGVHELGARSAPQAWFRVSRNNVAFLVRGAAYGGFHLHGQPAPSADEIRDAFIANVLARAEAAGIVLTGNEETTVRGWLGESSVPVDDAG